VRAFVTGATGFLGGRVAAKLRERGDEVVALVRSATGGGGLEAELVRGDLSDPAAIERALAGCDAVFHLAAVYEIGIPRSKRAAMFETNVHGTEHVLDAASAAGVPRIVYVSTGNVLGNTRGRVVDETYERPPDGYLSTYDWTKHLAHEAARERIDRGARIVIALPGAIYGPGDHSELGAQLDQMRTGRLRVKALAGVGVNAVHVDDAADGVLLTHDRGRLGESYVLGGQITTLGEMIDVVARLTGRRPPRLSIPGSLIKLMIPFGPLVGRMMGTGPNLRELVSASDAVTYWATDAKARGELGYAPRDLEHGLADLIAAAG